MSKGEMEVERLSERASGRERERQRIENGGKKVQERWTESGKFEKWSKIISYHLVIFGHQSKTVFLRSH